MSEIIAGASNIRTGGNPSYDASDFLNFYPQFVDVPEAMLTNFINMAHASVTEARWHDLWSYGMGLFIAHYATLYLQTYQPTGASSDAVAAAGRASGVVSSESAGDVSASYDYSTVAESLKGWGAYNLTTFGQQLATLGKIIGKGGMGVY